jgi:hypothetical protein
LKERTHQSAKPAERAQHPPARAFPASCSPPGARNRRPKQKCRTPGRAPTSLTPAARNLRAPESPYRSSAIAEEAEPWRLARSPQP